MRGIASAEKQASQPGRLMQRLALVVSGNIGSSSSEPESRERPSFDWNPVVHFGLGVAASGMIGAVALLGLLRLAPDQGSTPGDLSTHAVAALVPWPIASTPTAVGVRETHPAHAFDVVTPANVAAASTVARVRLIEGANDVGPRVAATEPPSDAMMRGNSTATAGGIDSPFPTQRTVASRRPGAAGEDKAARAPAPQRAATAVEATARMPQAAPQPRHWPEGASGLGAVARESERQVWWKMPALTWSPF